MDVAQVLIAIVGFGASVTTYCLMRFPHMRREAFRQYAACSVLVSGLAALAVLCFSLLVLVAQYEWQAR